MSAPARVRGRSPRSAGFATGLVARLAGTGLALAGLVAGGCATFSGAHVQEARTGEIVVRMTAPMTFDEIAERTYGDATLGRTVARVARLPYDKKVARGTVLVLPTRDRLRSELAVTEKADSHYDRGLAAVDRGNFRQAAESFRRALETAPDRADIRYNLGLALMQAGELADATAELERVAAARPGDADSRYAFGSVLRRRHAHARALKEFDAALRADSGHAAAAYARARTLADLGREDDATDAWDDFLRRFPDHSLAASARRHRDDPGNGSRPGGTGGALQP
ncbi:MAG: tetratricopeptide repeat protein [Gemmatimonadetes bacterium]|nr:tetratricopeptide repeat protein [Gemmatimonadota bacterium]